MGDVARRDVRLTDLLGVELPIIQAPMAGVQDQELSDFSTLWAGQAAPLGREVGAGELTRRLVNDARRLLGDLAI
jgi:nitronate monooxygenase